MRRLNIKLSRLRDIGWAEWDPIGLSDGNWPDDDCADEYDQYLMNAFILTLERDQAAAADYLLDVTVNYMGLNESSGAHQRAEHTAIALNKYRLELEAED